MLRHLALLLWPFAAQAEVTRADLFTLAQDGWTYELRTTMRRPGSADLLGDLNARTMAGAEVCLLGPPASGQSLETLTAFAHLMAEAFGSGPRFTPAPNPAACPNTPVFLRFFSTENPLPLLNADLQELNQRFGLRLGRHRHAPASPAQAQTFFGTKGAATHILVMQAGPGALPARHHIYYRSLLIEELYQSFTYGMDILFIDRAQPPFSKLQEVPHYARHLPWRSEAFINAILQTGPKGLCGADLVMLAALGSTTLERTNTKAFPQFVAAEMDAHLARAKAWQQDETVQILLDPACQTLPD